MILRHYQQPFELIEMIRIKNTMNDATDPSDPIDDALKIFNSLEEEKKNQIRRG